MVSRVAVLVQISLLLKSPPPLPPLRTPNLGREPIGLMALPAWDGRSRCRASPRQERETADRSSLVGGQARMPQLQLIVGWRQNLSPLAVDQADSQHHQSSQGINRQRAIRSRKASKDRNKVILANHQDLHQACHQVVHRAFHPVRRLTLGIDR